MLLRHQPRFNYYSAFYHVLDSISSELLSHPVTFGRVLVSNSSNHTSQGIKVDLAHCSDDDPAHHGTLDPTQQWVWSAAGSDEGQGQLRSKQNTGMCIDSLASQAPVLLTTCKPGRLSQLWVRNTTSGQIQSVATAPCLKHSDREKHCHRCFDDGSGAGASFLLWDCKSPQDPMIENQAFWYDPAESGIRCNTSKLCVSAEAAQGSGAVELHEYGSLAFISNTDNAQWLAVTYGSRQYVLQNHSVMIVNGTTGTVLFDTATAVDPPVDEQLGVLAHRQTPAVRSAAWQWYEEVAGVGARRHDSTGPHEQLNLTDNDSDYLWYNTTLPPGADATATVKASTGDGTILYTAVDAKARQVKILSCAMGLSNGGVGPKSVKGITGDVKVGKIDITQQQWTQQWFMSGEALQIFSPAGLSRVSWTTATMASNSAPLSWFHTNFDLPSAMEDQPAQTAYALYACLHCYSSCHGRWMCVWMSSAVCWHRADIGHYIPSNIAAIRCYSFLVVGCFPHYLTAHLPLLHACSRTVSSSFPNPASSPLRLQTRLRQHHACSYALDLSTMWKGQAWVNGFNIGRYWMTPGQCQGACAPPIKSGHCYMHWKGCGKPTQTMYHVPTSILKQTGNLVVLFEETGEV